MTSKSAYTNPNAATDRATVEGIITAAIKGVTPDEMLRIEAIATAMSLKGLSLGMMIDPRNLMLDLLVWNYHQPLDFAKLMNDRDTMLHDITGIVTNIDRKSATISDVFLAKSAIPQGDGGTGSISKALH